MTTQAERKIVVEGLGPDRRWEVRELREGEWIPVGTFDNELDALESSAMRKGRPPLRQRLAAGRPALAAGAAALVLVATVLRRALR